MTSEHQQQQNLNRQRRPRRRRSPSIDCSPPRLFAMASASGGGVSVATLLAALALILLPMEMAVASPPSIGRTRDHGFFSLRARGVDSFLSFTRRRSTSSTCLLQEQRRDLFSSSSSSSDSSLSFSFSTRRITTGAVCNKKHTALDDPQEEDELRELEALYGDDEDQQEKSNANVAHSACFRPKSSQDAARLQKASFSHSLQRRKQDTTTLFPETTTELQLLESSLCSKPTKGSGDRAQQTIPSSSSRTIGTTAATGAPAPAPNHKMTTTDLNGVTTDSNQNILSSADTVRGGNQKAAASAATRPLLFWESMVCGAISRSMAQTLLHPANAMKTILQNSRAETVASLMKPSAFRRLTKGAGANFLLSVPHGAVNFAVLEFVRGRLGALVASNLALQERSGRLGPTLDFASSAISTIVCSVVSTPQMMITDNIMAGNYNNLLQAITGLANRGGIVAFYRGWWPGLVGKIPSYALTWTLFQELKVMRDRLTHHRPATNIENAIMGCLASATTVTIMIPLDTIKTRLVTQGGSAVGNRVYKGIIDCAVRVAREEGIKSFYRGLPPRLASVVPMIGIQFGVYEAMKKVMLQRTGDAKMPEKVGGVCKEKKEAVAPVEPTRSAANGDYEASQVFEEAAMEVAASPEQPYPAPQFLKKRVYEKTLEQTEKTLPEQSLNKKLQR